MQAAETDAFVNTDRAIDNPEVVYDLASIQAAARADTVAFSDLRAGFHDELEKIWRLPAAMPAYNTAQLAAMGEARAAEAARQRTELTQRRNLVMTGAALLTAGTCLVGGAYAWLTERSALIAPPDVTPKPLPPQAPLPPDVIQNLTIKPLGEGILGMVALTGEVGAGVGAAALIGATAAAVIARQRFRRQRDRAALDAIEQTDETAPAAAVATEGDTSLSLVEKMMRLRQIHRFRLRDWLFLSSDRVSLKQARQYRLTPDDSRQPA